MKKMYIYFLLKIIVNPTIVYAQRGCCSHHGGVSGCNSYGRQICNDGTLSPTCTCTPPVQDVYGCTAIDSINYNSSATKDDGSCIKKVYGCMDKNAKNYNENANINDNSCIYYKRGCTDKNAINYDELAVPFYQKLDKNNKKTTRNADLLMGIGETVGCGERHEDYKSLKKSLIHHEVDEKEYEWYINLKKMFPMQTSGFGMGIERFLMWILKCEDIRNMQVCLRFNGENIVP